MYVDPSGLLVPRVPSASRNGGAIGGNLGGNGNGASRCDKSNASGTESLRHNNPNIEQVGLKETCLLLCHLLLGGGDNGGIKPKSLPTVYPTTKSDRKPGQIQD